LARGGPDEGKAEDAGTIILLEFALFGDAGGLDKLALDASCHKSGGAGEPKR
jgi:hypothetical protein